MSSKISVDLWTRKVTSFCKTFVQRLTARKPMSKLQADIEIQNGLRRALPWWQLTAIGLGGMIGESNRNLTSKNYIRNLLVIRCWNFYFEWSSSRCTCWSISDYFVYYLWIYCTSCCTFFLRISSNDVRIRSSLYIYLCRLKQLF